MRLLHRSPSAPRGTHVDELDALGSQTLAMADRFAVVIVATTKRYFRRRESIPLIVDLPAPDTPMTTTRQGWWKVWLWHT
jgi:hypothetical protein